MKEIARWTLWQRRWSIFWWCIGILFFVFLTLIFYPSFKNQASQFDQTFSQIPNTAKQLISDTNDFFTPVGYLSSQMFYLMMPLLLSILAINLGTSVLGKEERSTTVELLLARPVSRAKLLFGKALAALEIVTLVGALGIVATAVMCKLVGLDVAVANILEAGAAVWLMAISFGAIAFMISALGRAGRAAAIGVSSIFALGGYILVSLSGTVSWLRWPAKIFPFNYYHSSELLRGSYNWYNALFFVGLTALCLLVSWAVFRRRDLSGS